MKVNWKDTIPKAHHAVGMRLYIRPWRAREVDGWNKCTKTQWNTGEKTWQSLQNTCNLEKDLLSSKTMTQSIKSVLPQGWLKNNNVNILEWPNPQSRSQANWEFMSVLEKACPLMISMQPDKSRIVLPRRIEENIQWPDVETDREAQYTHKLKA